MVDAAARKCANDRRRWYRGDCHVHSVLSDGELTPDQLVQRARAAGLDFLASTEHNDAARRRWAGEAADLLVIHGEEVTTEDGHWLALGLVEGQVVDWRYRASDRALDPHLAAVLHAGGVSAVAHPFAPFPSGRFRYSYNGFDAVEVWNGLWTSDRPWNADNEAALAQWGRDLAEDVASGRWRPAIGGSDTHREGQVGLPHTVVLAAELTEAAILEAMRAGRCWVAASSAVTVSLQVTSARSRGRIGDRVRTRGGVALARVKVDGVPAGTLSLQTDHGEVRRTALPDRGPGAVEWQTTAAESAFVRVEVRRRDGQMAALTNPILLV